MPEGKITRQRVKDHFRRLWAVYLIGAVALCFLNHLVFTMTRPGYSDDETLKIMLLNTDISIAEEDLLGKVEHLGFRTVETVELTVAPEDETSRMLLITQLVSGFGDIYITGEAGLDVLNERYACHTVRELQSGLYLVVSRNGTNLETAQSAAEILVKELENEK